MGRLKRHALAVLMLSASVFGGHSAFAVANPNERSTTPPIRFCYENKALPPYFIGDGELPLNAHAGAIIDMLRYLAEQRPQFTWRFVRYPWKRCLQSLQEGEVDAVLMSYSQKRSQYAAFPMIGLEPDRAQAFAMYESCLVHQKRLQIAWDGEHLQLPADVTVAIPAGYNSIKKLRELGLTVFETSSMQQTKQLVLAGRIDATLTDCNDEVASHLVKITTPIITRIGYLAFSQAFYQHHHDFVEDLWLRAAELPRAKFYQPYQEEMGSLMATDDLAANAPQH